MTIVFYHDRFGKPINTASGTKEDMHSFALFGNYIFGEHKRGWGIASLFDSSAPQTFGPPTPSLGRRVCGASRRIVLLWFTTW